MHSRLAVAVLAAMPAIAFAQVGSQASTFCNNRTPSDGLTVTGNISAACTGALQVQNDSTLSHVVATDSASADLRTGTLRAVATSQALGGDERIYIGSLSSASFYDTVTVNGPLTSPLTVMLHLTIDGGFFSNDGFANISNSEISAKLVNSTTANSGIDVKMGASGGAFIDSQAGLVTTNLPTAPTPSPTAATASSRC